MIAPDTQERLSESACLETRVNPMLEHLCYIVVFGVLAEFLYTLVVAVIKFRHYTTAEV